MVQWPVFPPRGSVTQGAPAAILVLLARAARKRNDRLGLSAVIRRELREGLLRRSCGRGALLSDEPSL